LLNFRFTIASDCFLLSQKIIFEIIFVICFFLLQVPPNQPTDDDEDEMDADDEDEPATVDDENEPAKEPERMDTGVSRRQLYSLF